MSERIKRSTLLYFLIATVFVGAGIISAFFIQKYRHIEYEQISEFCEIAVERYPEIESQMLSALKDYHSESRQETHSSNYLERYGYRVEEFNTGAPYDLLFLLFCYSLLIVCIFVMIERVFHKSNRFRIAELTDYLERVNTGDGGILIQAKEDDYSHLQDEIYKTVTSMYQTRESAVAAKKNYAENLANIAHQLKTPITAASLSLQLLKNETENVHTDHIEKQLERLNRLEESLLMISRIDAGSLPLKHETVDLYTALSLAADNLRDLLDRCGVSIEIPENGCIEFCGDLEWIMEAFINLFKNCMEHSKAGATIHCDYSGNPLYAEIRIWDNGEGFDPEDLPHLFERFYRGKAAVGNGIGIGLALAKSIIELQNGTISAYNRPDAGACFDIRMYCH